MKTITPALTPTTFFLRADDLRAAFQCISTEQTRYYLGGVRGVFVEDDPIRVDFAASPRLRGTLYPLRWTGA